jgi:hypothetical protein
MSNDEGMMRLWDGWTEIRPGEGYGGWAVYALVNVVTGRVLVSSTTTLAKRLWDVRRCLDRGRHWNCGVQADLDLYGAETFKLYWVLRVESPTLLKIIKAAQQQRAAERGLAYNIKPIGWSRRKRPSR